MTEANNITFSLPLQGIDEKLYTRFLKHINKTDTCWLWTGGTDKDGYGKIKIANVNKRVHRISWLLYKGEIPENLQINHKCDVTLCVNPDHLKLGTQQDNMKDKTIRNRTTKGRTLENPGSKTHPEKILKGEKHGKSKLTEKQILEIRQAYILGETQQNIANKYNLNQKTVSDIINRKRWKHLK